MISQGLKMGCHDQQHSLREPPRKPSGHRCTLSQQILFQNTWRLSTDTVSLTVLLFGAQRSLFPHLLSYILKTKGSHVEATKLWLCHCQTPNWHHRGLECVQRTWAQKHSGKRKTNLTSLSVTRHDHSDSCIMKFHFQVEMSIPFLAFLPVLLHGSDGTHQLAW